MDEQEFAIDVSDDLIRTFGPPRRLWITHLPGDETPTELNAEIRQKYEIKSNLLDPDFINSAYECMRPTPLHGPNEHLCNLLSKLEHARILDGNEVGALAYQHAIAALRAYPRPITPREAAEIHGIGSRMLERINEFSTTGSIKDAVNVDGDERLKAFEVFQKVYGVGHRVAMQWYERGYRTLNDVKTFAKLNERQRVWIEHYDDLTTPFD